MSRLDVLTILLLFHPLPVAAQNPECDAVSRPDASVLDRSWNALAGADFVSAQNTLFYFGNDLTDELRKKSGAKLDSVFVGKTQRDISDHLVEIQHVLMWQQITLLRAKLELARAKGVKDLVQINKDFENFKIVYCTYYNNYNLTKQR
jgi:hypothetical protein